MTNNLNKTTENIVNDNAVYNIVNQVVKCDCNKHDPSDYECACEDCLDEQVERLNEMLIRKAVLDTEERIIKLLKEHEAISDGSEGGDSAICVCQHWSGKAEVYVDHIERLISEGDENEKVQS